MFLPASNRALQERMREQLAISQFQKSGGPQNGNRTMAFISAAAVIIVAGERSGTVHLGGGALPPGALSSFSSPRREKAGVD